MAKIVSTKDLLLHFLYVEGASNKLCDPIIGTTRFQKILFLFEKEIWKKFKLDKHISSNALPEFEAYNFGPFSKQISEDLDFLTSIDFVNVSLTNIDLTEVETEEESYGDYINIGEEKTYALSSLGREFIEKGNAGVLSENQRSVLSDFKKRSCTVPLKALLIYVYKTYPEMTVKSKIKDKILQGEGL